MTRREFTRRIAEQYAAFEADVRDHHPDGKPQPLDREWAFYRGRELIARGEYAPRGRYGYLDYSRVAYEARKQLPSARALIARVNAEYPERHCAACGGRFQA